MLIIKEGHEVPYTKFIVYKVYTYHDVSFTIQSYIILQSVKMSITSIIPLWLNANVKYQHADNHLVKSVGFCNWRNENTFCYVYFYMEKEDKIHIKVQVTGSDGDGYIKSIVKQKAKEDEYSFTVAAHASTLVDIGEYDVKQGWVCVKFVGLAKLRTAFAEIVHLEIKSKAKIIYNTDRTLERRVSGSIQYDLPIGVPVDTFFCKVKIPSIEHATNYYPIVCNGAEFGFEIDENRNVHIVFYVHSTYENNRAPNLQSLQHKTIAISHHEYTGVQEDGREKTSMHCYFNYKYEWVDNEEYYFLLHITPDTQKNSMFYKAYFWHKNIGKGSWIQIAYIRRPKETNTMERVYSKIIHKSRKADLLPRKVLFGSQWAYSKVNDQWYSIKSMRIDETDDFHLRPDTVYEIEGKDLDITTGNNYDGGTVIKSFKRKADGPCKLHKMVSL